MKKVVYESGSVGGETLGGMTFDLVLKIQNLGYQVKLSRDVPDEPKVERCEILNGRCEPIPLKTYLNDPFLHYARHTDSAGTKRPIHVAVSDPDFEGFEFEDGMVSVVPWRIMNKTSIKQPIISTKDNIGAIEHAKYVLFRVKP